MRPQLDELLRYLMEVGGSDLHLKAGSPPKVRVDGDLFPLTDVDDLTPEDTERIAQETMTPLARDTYDKNMDTDYAYRAAGVGRFRVNAFSQRGSVSVVMRHVATSVPNFDELGLPPILERLASERRGLVLVTGPTGSGKSTTLAAMVDHINRNRNVNIITIEDPIEILHRDHRATVSQREIGTDATSFSRAMRAALRQDPDVIMVGEMRDLETVSAVLQAAETGHLVLSSLHTTDATETVNRVVDQFPANQQRQARLALAGTLRGTVAQRLVPRATGGRVAVCETMIATGRVQHCIINPEATAELGDLIEEGDFYGMQTFDRALADLTLQGVVSHKDALEAASSPHDLQVRLDRASAPGARPSQPQPAHVTEQIAALNQSQR